MPHGPLRLCKTGCQVPLAVPTPSCFFIGSLPSLPHTPALTCSPGSPPRSVPHTQIFISGSALGGAQTELRWSQRLPSTVVSMVSLRSPQKNPTKRHVKGEAGRSENRALLPAGRDLCHPRALTSPASAGPAVHCGVAEGPDKHVLTLRPTWGKCLQLSSCPRPPRIFLNIRNERHSRVLLGGAGRRY